MIDDYTPWKLKSFSEKIEVILTIIAILGLLALVIVVAVTYSLSTWPFREYGNPEHYNFPCKLCSKSGGLA